MFLYGPVNLVYGDSMAERILNKSPQYIVILLFTLSNSILGAKIQWRDHGKRIFHYID